MVIVVCRPIPSLVEITTRSFDRHENVTAGIMGRLWLLVQKLVSMGLHGREQKNRGE
jgi:hypothetical protein